jgi:putative transposase
MPRLPRIRIAGFPFHVVQRGNDRHLTFFSDTDYRSYVDLLLKMSRRYETSVHAYVLMANHVHLLLTSHRPDGISRTMQQVAAGHARRINDRRGRTGTLWESRFKSSPIDSERYCLACYRYIELNPVRAGICARPGDYPWSSFNENAGKQAVRVTTPHPCYLELGSSPERRFFHYRQLFRDTFPDRTLLAIRGGSARGLPVGSEAFRQRVENELGMPLTDRKRGRPRRVSAKKGSDPN